jgi:fumarate reductase flavoprotein subunit
VTRGGRRDAPPGVQGQLQDERHRLERDLFGSGRGTERLADIRHEMQETMEDSAGIYRSGDSLTKATNRIGELRERFDAIGLDDNSVTFNTERIAALELSYMLDVADCIIQSGLQREESRGAHQRTDFPARDDERFLAHSLAYRDPDGSCRIDYLPVTITRWPPGERIYGS